jgi:hypothetical protein
MRCSPCRDRRDKPGDDSGGCGGSTALVSRAHRSAQRERSGAMQNRDRANRERLRCRSIAKLTRWFPPRSRLCGAPLRAAPRPGHESGVRCALAVSGVRLRAHSRSPTRIRFSNSEVSVIEASTAQPSAIPRHVAGWEPCSRARFEGARDAGVQAQTRSRSAQTSTRTRGLRNLATPERERRV